MVLEYPAWRPSHALDDGSDVYSALRSSWDLENTQYVLWNTYTVQVLTT